MKHPYTRWMFDGYKTLVMRKKGFFDLKIEYNVLEKGVFKNPKIIGKVTFSNSFTYSKNISEHCLRW